MRHDSLPRVNFAEDLKPEDARHGIVVSVFADAIEMQRRG
jgi:hypothetical protein